MNEFTTLSTEIQSILESGNFATSNDLSFVKGGDEYARNAMRNSMYDYNEYSKVLSLGVCGHCHNGKDEFPPFIVSCDKPIIENITIDNDKQYFVVKVSWQGVYRKWNDNYFKRTMNRTQSFTVKFLKADIHNSEIVTAFDYLRGYRTDRMFIDTINRLITTEEKRLHDDLVSAGLDKAEQ